MIKKRQQITILIVLAVVVLGVVLVRLNRRGEADVPAPSATDEGFHLEAHLEHVRDWNAETGFDQEAHERAVRQLGPLHLELMTEAGVAADALREYEHAERRSDPERAAIADAIDAVTVELDAQFEALQALHATDTEWQRLSERAADADATLVALRRELAAQAAALRPAEATDASSDPTEPDPTRQALEPLMNRLREAAAQARDYRAALERRELAMLDEREDVRDRVEALRTLGAQIQEKEQALRTMFADDPGWLELNARRDEVEVLRDQARQRLQAVIRARMQIEHEIEQAARGATNDDQTGDTP